MSQPTARPTLADVARLANVSTATVSYVLNGRNGRVDASRISSDTQTRVLAAIAELGYVPNHAARSLRRRRTERVCLVLRRLGVPFSDVMIAELQALLGGAGYSLVMMLSHSKEYERQIVEQMHRGLADAVIFDFPRLAVGEFLSLGARGIAVVAMVNDAEPDVNVDIVHSEDGHATFQAVSHLIKQGHHRIGFIGFPETVSPNDRRLAAYQEALRREHLPLDRALVRVGAESRAAAYRAATALLSLPSRPTAIMAAADVAAIATYWAARNATLSVPGDLAIIGTGNIEEGQSMSPALSTIGPRSANFNDIGDLLMNRLTGNAPDLGHVLVRPWDLHLRGTT